MSFIVRCDVDEIGLQQRRRLTRDQSRKVSRRSVMHGVNGALGRKISSQQAILISRGPSCR